MLSSRADYMPLIDIGDPLGADNDLSKPPASRAIASAKRWAKKKALEGLCCFRFRSLGVMHNICG